MKTVIIKPCGFIAETKLYEAETIEEKVQRVVESGEPIEDGAPIIYTERKNGVNPAHDIRTDRWDIAIMAMDSINKTRIAKADGTPTKESEEPGDEPPSQRADA